MENHGSPYHYNQSYGYPYRYPPHQGSSSPYPPPNSSSPYGYPPHHHHPPPYQYPYSNAPVSSPSYPPPPGHSPSSPSPTSPHHRPSYSAPPNFDYYLSGPPPYSYPYGAPTSPAPPPGYVGPTLHHDEASASSPALCYPPSDMMNNVHLSDNQPKATPPASPPSARYDMPPHEHIVTPPSARYDMPPPEHLSTPPAARYDMPPPEHLSTPPTARYDAPPPEHMSTPSSARYDASSEVMSTAPNARYDKRNNFYGGYGDSFSNNWEPTYPAPSAYAGPMSHDGPREGPDRPRHKHSRSSSLSEIPSSPMAIVPNKRSLKVLLLHGNLDIWIYEAKNLPNMDMFSRTLEEVINRVACNAGSKHHGQGPGQPPGSRQRSTSDPYVSISVANAVVGRTYVISNNENPVWMQHFNFPVAHYASEVQFLVKDSDIVGSQIIGAVSIPVEELSLGNKLQGTYPIINSYGKPCRSGSNLSLSIQYIPAQELSFYHEGVGAGPDYGGVPGTYFPLRRGGRVSLYQDAHVPDGFLPHLKLEHGMYYVHGKCWHDVFNAVRQARRLIYITGWSVWYKVKLVRDAGYAADSSLGELLRSKSAEGVRVLLLIWDDPTSRNILGYKTDGIMATHDEETRRFFKHSSVQVLLCPRNAGKRHSWMKQTEVGTIYTHHQKTVIVDADAGNNRRKIVAFVGGLDICDGRYDNPDHPLFRTLNTLHGEDYHNPTYTGSLEGCPREPWHDLHSKIDGPAAYDVLTNFEERWLKAAKPAGIKKLKKLYDDALLRTERIPDIIGVNEASRISENDPETWHVQIFRSIDSNSVKGFPKDPKAGTSKNLACGKNLLIDMSIHTAYVKAIRSAQHFIYIENQYFIGSSYNWSSYKEIGANNLIPMEIALKIADKIRANERFASYIVIPMWPEGVPTGAATQRILYWQNKTMQMMYEIIYKALVEAGLEEAFTPLDYLIFFCLGNREASESGPNSFSAGSPTTHAAHTPQALSKKYRRFMIYVHSKGMIVDDEFVIIGSANINQRSMEGVRDTEIAMGGYQPQYTWAKKQSNPRGQIYGYRMSLWAEHTGTVEDCFVHPESLECVKRVRLMGELNWKQFAAEEVTEMRGHLMKYPVEVDRRGKVKPIPGHETFPDVGGNICGSFLAIQENLTI